MKTKLLLRVLFIAALASLLFSCVHAPIPVTHQISLDESSFTDAADRTDLVFWRNIELRYYRSGQEVYMEWGKVFKDDRNCGRILVYSPDKDTIDTRSYAFEDADLDPEDDYAMESLLGPVLINGWVFSETRQGEGEIIIVRAIPGSSDDTEIYREPDYQEVAFFMNMFFVFFEFWIDLILD